MRYLGVILGAGLVLTACAPEVPNSAAGVGFDSYDSYAQARQAELSATPSAVPTGPVIASETMAALGRSTPGTTVPTTAGAPAAAAAAPLNATTIDINNPAISDEQSFEAVAGRETIESDAARIAANREAYVVIQPTELPQRPDGGGPNIVAFALATNHPVGAQLYDRSGVNAQNRFNRACGSYTSSDLAQEDFLAQGGPERDRLGVDPDGDGYACFWDPTPFRAARVGGG
jgi:hypothetical protein